MHPLLNLDGRHNTLIQMTAVKPVSVDHRPSVACQIWPGVCVCCRFCSGSSILMVSSLFVCPSHFWTTELLHAILPWSHWNIEMILILLD